MFGSIFSHLRLTDEIASARSSARSGQMAAESAIIPLESRLDHLELACAGLWCLLKTKHGYTDEDLIDAIQQVDAADGNLDGKIGHISKTCPHCQRRLLSRDSPKCSWCGGDLAVSPL